MWEERTPRITADTRKYDKVGAIGRKTLEIKIIDFFELFLESPQNESNLGDHEDLSLSSAGNII